MRVGASRPAGNPASMDEQGTVDLPQLQRLTRKLRDHLPGGGSGPPGTDLAAARGCDPENLAGWNPGTIGGHEPQIARLPPV